MIESVENLPNFDICSVLRELMKEFYGLDKNIFRHTLLVGMQHVLSTTVDMLSIMKEYGLREAVIGGKKYSTHQNSTKK